MRSIDGVGGGGGEETKRAEKNGVLVSLWCFADVAAHLGQNSRRIKIPINFCFCEVSWILVLGSDRNDRVADVQGTDRNGSPDTTTTH